VVFNFDECGAPKPEAPGQPTYFQRGLSDLVPWRWEEAVRRFKDGAEARDLLPVVVISGTHSAYESAADGVWQSKDLQSGQAHAAR
jgi:hypothetical protein